MELFNYKGYQGSIKTSIEDECLYGKILFITDLVTYEAETLSDLKIEFEAAVDDYIATCSELNREPLKPLSGTFNVRIGPYLHKKCALKAIQEDISLNKFIAKALEKQLSNEVVVQETHNHNSYNIREEIPSIAFSRNHLNQKPQVVDWTTKTSSASP